MSLPMNISKHTNGIELEASQLVTWSTRHSDFHGQVDRYVLRVM